MSLIVNFRPNREMFEEAMAKKKTFSSVGNLKMYIAGRPKIEYYCHDKRIPADTFIVTDAGHVIGFVWFEEEA